MAHFTMTRGDSWPTSTAITKAHLESLDAKVFSLINADRGGTWKPSSAITISSNSAGPLHLTGPLELRGSGVNFGSVTTSGTGLIVLDTGDWERFGASHADRARTYVTPCLRATGYPSFGVRLHMQYQALQAVAASYRSAIDGSTAPITWRLPLRVSDGSTLASLSLTYRSLLGSPRIRVERVDGGGIATPLTSAAAGADPSGYIRATPTDTTTETATGLPAINTVTVPIDGGANPSNALVDNSLYSYFLRVIEDSTLSSTFPNQVPVAGPVKLATVGANITLSGTGSLDGIAYIAGDRILVKDQTDPTKNGIYVAAAGAWSLAADSPNVGLVVLGLPLPAGLIVYVRAGSVNAGTYWQLQQQTLGTLALGQTYGVTPANPLLYTGNAFLARGNLYYAATVSMTGISDNRWQ